MNYYSRPGMKREPPLLKTDMERANEILKMVCEFFGQREQDVKSAHRYQRFVTPRYTAMYFIKECTSLNLKDIGSMFSRDHTTIIHAMKTVRNMKQTDPAYLNKFKALEMRLS